MSAEPLQFSNPRSFRCTAPGCSCNGKHPLRLGCATHGHESMEALAEGFVLHLYCVKCEKTVLRLRLHDPGVTSPIYFEEA